MVTSVPALFAGLVNGYAWGQMSKGGKFHAFRQAWWDENKWVPECNRHAEYGDLQLHSLDARPGADVCAQAGCSMAYANLKSVEGRR